MRRAVCGLAALLASPAAAAPPRVLAPHRAVYDLSLEQAGNGETVAASGNMTFEVHDACSAWATEQTLTINSVDREGHQSATRSDYATFETKDGQSFNFTMRQTNAGHDQSDIRGHANVPASGAAGSVTFSEPPNTMLALPAGTLFPMSHTKAVLQAAADGKRSLSPILFDGTGTDGAEYTYASILDWGASSHAPGPLSGMPSGRIHIAFYPLHGSAMTPEYEIGSRYFANGVSDRLDMDFGDYRLHGKLRTLELLPSARGCGK